MSLLTKLRNRGRKFIDVPLVRKDPDGLKSVRPGTYRVGVCQDCGMKYGYHAIEAAGLTPKMFSCVCGGTVRLTPDYCKVK